MGASRDGHSVCTVQYACGSSHLLAREYNAVDILTDYGGNSCQVLTPERQPRYRVQDTEVYHTSASGLAKHWSRLPWSTDPRAIMRVFSTIHLYSSVSHSFAVALAHPLALSPSLPPT
jgi:hypothetical protein